MYFTSDQSGNTKCKFELETFREKCSPLALQEQHEYKLDASEITDHPVHEEHDEDEGEDEGEEETTVAEQAEPLAFPEDDHLES